LHNVSVTTHFSAYNTGSRKQQTLFTLNDDSISRHTVRILPSMFI